MWIHPFLGLPFCVLTSSVRSVKSGFNIFALVALLIGAISYIFTGKVTTLLACTLVFFWLALDPLRSTEIPNLWYAYSTIAAGVVASIGFTLGADGRTGLLGNEINFSGYMVFIFWIIALERRWNLLVCILLIIGCLLVTKSRSLFINLGISLLLYILRGRALALMALFLGIFN